MATNNAVMPTPVNAERLKFYLADYDSSEREFLYKGFSVGFHIPFRGRRISKVSINHTSATINSAIVKQNIDEEIASGRVRGPFLIPPCEPFICLPLALVPKHETGSFRLIHNLSYPPDESVNSGIDRADSQVVYDCIDTIISLVRHFGMNALMAKTNITNAFRLLPIHGDTGILLALLGLMTMGLYSIIWIVVYLWVFLRHVNFFSVSALHCNGS